MSGLDPATELINKLNQKFGRDKVLAEIHLLQPALKLVSFEMRVALMYEIFRIIENRLEEQAK